MSQLFFFGLEPGSLPRVRGTLLPGSLGLCDRQSKLMLGWHGPLC